METRATIPPNIDTAVKDDQNRQHILVKIMSTDNADDCRTLSFKFLTGCLGHAQEITLPLT
jgi:hypothetical protein